MKELLDKNPISVRSLGKTYGIDGKQLECQYRDHLSDFHSWDQLLHAEDYIIFPKNIGPYLSLDETSLSMGELYTIITNKAAKGQKGALVAMIKGISYDKIQPILNKIPLGKRNKVIEVTCDMAGCMQNIAKYCFPKAIVVTDRFHVQKLAYDAVQEMRISYRWEAIDNENKEMELAKEVGRTHKPHILENGETVKQMLARSRYLLFKRDDKWTPSQRQRAEILFEYYPNLQKAYDLAMQLGYVYNQTKDKNLALTRLAKWYNKVEIAGFKSFNTVANSIQLNYKTILNYFKNRNTNASAESFNAKIKGFRTQFRGVRNVTFFLYRLAKIYA